MDYKDYYKIMGLNRNASAKEIKAAYRRLARKYHPDISKESNAEEHFKEVGEAYEVLKNPEKRKMYDQYAENWQAYQQAEAAGARPRPQAESFDMDSDFFESLFGSAFSGASHRGQPRKGADIQGSLHITLEEAHHGTVKEFTLSTGGLHEGSPQRIRVKIPAGVKPQQQIRLAGKGAPDRSGKHYGDLYITIHIEKHPLFDVMGQDVYLTLPITPWEAALGTTLVVPTLEGKVDLKIPAGSQGGQTLRLKKRGLRGATSGDQFVLLKIIIPQPTNDETRALYLKMKEAMPFNPRAAMES